MERYLGKRFTSVFGSLHIRSSDTAIGATAANVGQVNAHVLGQLLGVGRGDDAAVRALADGRWRRRGRRGCCRAGRWRRWGRCGSGMGCCDSCRLWGLLQDLQVKVKGSPWVSALQRTRACKVA